MEQMIELLEKENIIDAARIFQETPLFNYHTESPLLKLAYFEYSDQSKKNPVFLRILLNYISLINCLFEKKPLRLHEILFKFNAKFTYEELDNQYIKLILLVKTTPEVYNIVFKEGIDLFKNRNDIDLGFWDKNEVDIGYSFQELGRIFINDYVIGREKGIELPNIVFYIKSIKEIEDLVGKVFIIPTKFKLNLNEKISKSGINEYDHVIEMTQNLIINENNSYFRYIKNAKDLDIQYGDLTLDKKKIYIIELKHSFKKIENKKRIENLGYLYLKLYNNNTTGEENQAQMHEFQILYFYNYFENLGYGNFTQISSLNLNLWRFLYLKPSCQIVPMVKLSSEVSKLKKNVSKIEDKLNNQNTIVETLNNKIKVLNEDKLKKDNEIKILNNIMLQLNTQWKKKFGEEIINEGLPVNNAFKFDPLVLQKKQEEKFSINRELKFEIEEILRQKMRKIKKINDFTILDEVFKMYQSEINEFEKDDEFQIKEENTIWKTNLKKEIEDSDFKTCYEVLVPCIGFKKASNNYFKIQKFLSNKIRINDEMSNIYHCIYLCFYGERTENDNKSKEKFFNGADPKMKNLLKNIIKYTFHYDKKRKGKEYYLLALLKLLLVNGNEEIHENILKLKNNCLFDLVFISIVLLNAENRKYIHGYTIFQ